MKYNLSTSLLLICLLSGSTAYAEMYKGVDEEGKVEYSDEPFTDADKFDAPPISVVEPPHLDSKEVLSAEPAEKTKKHTEDHYTSFHIVSPKDGQSIWNDPGLSVSLQLQPPLDYQNKHTIWLLLDGQPLEKDYESLTIPTGRLERGSHKLQAQVRDRNSKLVRKSNTVLVFIHYSSKN